jgi:hypothetical protein
MRILCKKDRDWIEYLANKMQRSFLYFDYNGIPINKSPGLMLAPGLRLKPAPK